MPAKTYLYTVFSALMLIGCAANTTGVTPSQNTNLQIVSPSGTAVSEGGLMQRSLDSWLKEEWTPITETTLKTSTAADGTVIQTKTEAAQVTTTTTAPDGKVVTTTKAVVTEPADEAPFTLQSLADKWKKYHEKQEKLNERKPKEASNVEKLESMPAIGK
jgi:hypothetical protein